VNGAANLTALGANGSLAAAHPPESTDASEHGASEKEDAEDRDVTDQTCLEQCMIPPRRQLTQTAGR